MASRVLVDTYPGERTLSEARRLQAQHDLIVDALGGLVLCPLDVSKPGLRILDVGGADGYFLEQLRFELGDPQSAYLVGTDIKPYPENRQGVDIMVHDFRTPFPEEWKSSFDMVQIRNCLASTGSQEAAIKVIQKLLELVKPETGWLQIVDGVMHAGKIDESDSPFEKLCKTIGNLLRQFGLDSSIGGHVSTLLPRACGDKIADLGSRNASSLIGKGCSPGMEKTGYDEIRGLIETADGALVKMHEPPITADAFNVIGLDSLREAQEIGVSMPWYAAWARRI